MKKTKISWNEIFKRLNKIPKKETLFGVPKGGMLVIGFSGYSKTVDPGKATLIVDNVIDSGKTMAWYKERFPDIPFVALFDKRPGIGDTPPDEWLVFPWEADHPNVGGDSIHENIIRQLQYIGEDVNREGLKETPNRIVRMWDEVFAGYNKNPEDVLTTFAADGYDQIVLSKDIELYSTCEHHMLPFFGKAHVAYIPGDRVIGISKLARLVDIYARRLQIQERLGEQVTTAMMKCLKPKGAACIIEAKHLCMMMRGVGKQNSVMVTSSLKGEFLEEPKARNELMGLIR